jgi:hypothetical protein
LAEVVHHLAEGEATEVEVQGDFRRVRPALLEPIGAREPGLVWAIVVLALALGGKDVLQAVL